MLTRRIRIQVVVFIVVGLVATAYLGARYVGIGGWFGGQGYAVSAQLPATGGIFKGGEVTYRGVPVGRIGALTLTRDGVAAQLKIDADAPPIPRDVAVSVANRSAIGEQYVDLKPSSSAGPYLRAGDVVKGTAAELPPDTNKLLKDSLDFASSVPLDDLRTVVDQSYLAFQGSADNIRRLLDTSQQYVATADRNYLVTSGLIENSATVLATQQESAGSIKDFSKNLNLFAGALKDSDGDLRALIADTPAAANQVNDLFKSVGLPLGTLLANLVTPADVFGTNAGGVENVMVNLPKAVSVGNDVTSSKSLDIGLATAFFDPLPCTAGYSGTTMRPGTDATDGKAFNTDAGCTASPASGTDVRGPGAAPRTSSTREVGRITVPDSLADLMGGQE